MQHLRAIDGTPIIGVTCLAAGADQIFARAIRTVGGTYEVVLPSPDYRSTVPQTERKAFDDLLAAARTVIHTGEARAGLKAYIAANHIMLGRVNRLIAVWDGVHGNLPGGTSDVMGLAGQRGVLTTVIWPVGARRS